jgi:hypothetical protein
MGKIFYLTFHSVSALYKLRGGSFVWYKMYPQRDLSVVIERITSAFAAALTKDTLEYFLQQLNYRLNVC